MAPVATFVKHETDTTIADQNKVSEKASKKKPVAATKVYGDIMEEQPNRLHLGRGEHQSRRSSRLPSKICHVNWEEHHVERHSHSLKSSKGNYDSQTESESDEEVL